MKIKENWQEEFFIDGWDFLQDVFLPPERAVEEINFIDRFAKEKGYLKVLDIPCGTGRISLPLAEKGYDVTGIDFNPNVIKLAKERSGDKKVEFLQGDMREITYKEEFDLISCMWGSIGYFSDDEDFNFFRASHDALRPGGAMIIDTFTLEIIMRIYSQMDARKFESGYLIEDREYDLRNSRINVEWTYISEEKKFKIHSSIRLYTYKELLDMLQKAGFKEFLPFGGFNDEKFSINSRRLELIAIK